jgi:hypothetical protein
MIRSGVTTGKEGNEKEVCDERKETKERRNEKGKGKEVIWKARRI